MLYIWNSIKAKLPPPENFGFSEALILIFVKDAEWGEWVQ